MCCRTLAHFFTKLSHNGCRKGWGFVGFFFFFLALWKSETMPLRHSWVTWPTDSLVWCLKWMSCTLLYRSEVEISHVSYAQHSALSVSSSEILISKPVFLQSHKHLEIVHYSCYRNQTLESLFDLPGNIPHCFLLLCRCHGIWLSIWQLLFLGDWESVRQG